MGQRRPSGAPGPGGGLSPGTPEASAQAAVRAVRTVTRVSASLAGRCAFPPVRPYQDLELQQGANMLFYRGANPRYAGTATPYPTYSPDAFRLVEMQSGVWSITEVCDEQGVCAPVQTQPLP